MSKKDTAENSAGTVQEENGTALPETKNGKKKKGRTRSIG